MGWEKVRLRQGVELAVYIDCPLMSRHHPSGANRHNVAGFERLSYNVAASRDREGKVRPVRDYGHN
jgi:hypothetical protein